MLGINVHANQVNFDTSNDVQNPLRSGGSPTQPHIVESIHDHSNSHNPLRRAGQGVAAKLRSMFSNSQRHRWQPEQRFVISTMTDGVIKTGSRVNAIDHGVPGHQRFEMSAEASGRFGASIFDSGTALSGLDKTCRLDLHGHGNMSAFENETPYSLASKLYNAGLKEVGVLKLHSCSVGKGSFPEDFVRELGRFGIGVGYVSAAVSSMSDLRAVGKIGGKEFVYRPVFYAPAKFIGARLETFGLKVTKGNIDVQFPGTRYRSK